MGSWTPPGLHYNFTMVSPPSWHPATNFGGGCSPNSFFIRAIISFNASSGWVYRLIRALRALVLSVNRPGLTAKESAQSIDLAVVNKLSLAVDEHEWLSRSLAGTSAA